MLHSIYLMIIQRQKEENFTEESNSSQEFPYTVQREVQQRERKHVACELCFRN